MKGRQIAGEIARVGLRLQLRKAQAEAGDIVLLYGDESEALTHPYLARAWAKRGADLRVPAPGQAKKVAMIGSLDHLTRQLIVHTSPTKRSSDFIAHLEQLDRLYGPQPGRAMKPVVLVEDNGPIHVSKLALAALEARKHWLTVEWLPKYAPELNDIEVVWHDLKAHNLAHYTFTDAADLDRAIHQAVQALNNERSRRAAPTPRQSVAGRAPLPFRARYLVLDVAQFASRKGIALVRIDSSRVSEAHLLKDPSRRRVDRHRRGDDAQKSHVGETPDDERRGALRGEATAPGFAAEPVAELGDAFVDRAEREPS